ncbi:EI24 domain-containing protein [Thauera sinica]|uniref:EI24 domain-containing protein n=1 Tax=Thauera sinica TaxID=2665146 RepID=A0ABW1AY50_9RHOO|nr:EI24 domain-containing protein [Thauera sp. K11]ATE59052.1 hypothetical protein CCZ27_02940 [Thauera sp. K11]
MKEILVAFGRAFRSLWRRDIFWHLVWPGLVAVVLWITIAVLQWEPMVATLFAWVQAVPLVGEWLTTGEAVAAIVLVLLKIGLALVFVPLIYVTAAVLVAVIALPLMLERVGRRDYADLEQRRGGSNAGSAFNAVAATLMFGAALLVSLPFWLIPGVGLIVPVLLTGWLNQRAFGYDALMLHADADELRRLRAEQRLPMLALGGACALLAYVPVLNLIAPAYSGLAFVHFMLEALRRERVRNGVTLLDAAPKSLPRTDA